MSSWWILATDAISVMNSRGSSSHKEGSFTLRGRLVLKKNSDGVIPAIITDERNCAFATNSPRHISQKKTSNHYNPSVLLMILLISRSRGKVKRLNALAWCWIDQDVRHTKKKNVYARGHDAVTYWIFSMLEKGQGSLKLKAFKGTLFSKGNRVFGAVVQRLA